MTSLSRTILKTSVRRTLNSNSSIASFTTYSGGQPSEGQGGFYGSLKSRSEATPVSRTAGASADPNDLKLLSQLMAKKQLDAKTLDNEETKALFKRLIHKGAPVWGLSTEERAFVEQYTK